MSNSTATNPPPSPVAAAGFCRPSKPPESPTSVESGEMTKARPPPTEEGLRLVTEKEKKVAKLAGEGDPGSRNLTGAE